MFGQAALSPEPAGYAKWDCSWTGSKSVPHVWVELLRDYPVDAGDYGRLIDVKGRQAAVDSTGDTFGRYTCVVRVVHRRYNSNASEDAETEPKTEQIRIHVGTKEPSLPMDAMCGRARQLAEIAATRLPR